MFGFRIKTILSLKRENFSLNCGCLSIIESHNKTMSF